MPDDLASAARRVGEDIRRGAWPGDDDLLALLPLLDAAASGPGADRVGDAMSHAARRVLINADNLERPNFGDLGLLKPLLAAVAKGRGNFTRAVAAAFGAEMYGDGRPWGSFDEREQDALMRGARAAIALADAERAAAAAEGWAAYEAARDAYGTANNVLSDAKVEHRAAAWEGVKATHAALDAAVRRLAGMRQEEKP